MPRESLLPLLLLFCVPTGRPVDGGGPGSAVWTAPRAATEDRQASPADRSYVGDQLLVAPPPGISVTALAHAVGGQVVAEVGLSGYGALLVADQKDASARLEELGAVTTRMGRIVGAGSRMMSASAMSGQVARPTPDLWHLSAMGLPPGVPGNLSGWVVAVLDSGVAYETDAGHVRATGLATVPFVDPVDFVELDGHPNDDHQHGTHIASLIASQGWIKGIAPGVTLMPVKILDRYNQGTEWALIEGIHHAVDHGADVINLSVSFPLGYTPSLALQDALVRADDAGIVMVAAGGNEDLTELTWPAASRLVIAVGASSPTSRTTQTAADYSNRGPRVDVLAPGGTIAVDRTADTWPDGVLAETIEPGDPTRLGYWFYQGTSQATALVSGAVVRLLAAGVDSADVRATLQAEAYVATNSEFQGFGVTTLDVDDALDHQSPAVDVLSGLLPWLAPSGALAVPSARVVTVDGAGDPIEGAVVVVTINSEAGTTWASCTTDEDGRCDVSLIPTASEHVWAFQLDTVEVDNVAHRPAKALFASDGGEVVLTALDAAALEYDALGVYWPAGVDAELGSMLPSFAIIDAGVGPATSPFAVLVAESAVSANVTLVPVDLDGTGLLSSPLGFTTVRIVTFDGSGLLSSPLGARTLTFAGLDGSGLLSSPLGFHASHLYLGGTGLLSSPLGLVSPGTPLRLDTGLAIGSSLDGTALQALVDSEDGLRTADGFEPATLLVASGAVSVGLAAATTPPAPGTVPPVRWTP